MSNFIRDFRKFQSKKRKDTLNLTNKSIDESVVVRDNKYVVGGVVVEQSFINAYAKKVKDQTGKTLKQMYSDQDIAEELVKYLVDTHGDVENIPVSALLGGEEGMEEEVDDISMEDPAEVEDDSIVDEPAEEEVPAEVEGGEPEGEEEFAAEPGDDFEKAFDEEPEGEGEAEAEGEGTEDFDAEVDTEDEGEGEEDLFADDEETGDDEENIFDESGESKDDEEEEEDLPLA